jgi:aspartyl-tRNA(Asn)/glutamyl-tRNA(Gln) amidotransferase subunit B
LITELAKLLYERGTGLEEMEHIRITPENFADLVALVEKGELTSRIAKDILPAMQETGDDPRAIIASRGMQQVSDRDAIRDAAEAVIQDYTAAAADYRNGKKTALQFLIGKTMARLHGKGNPQAIQEALIRILVS